MNEQIKQALVVLQTVVNAATSQGVFKTAQEAAIADGAIKLLYQAATPLEAEKDTAETPVKPKKRKSKVEKV